jgi:hypothetical protein
VEGPRHQSNRFPAFVLKTAHQYLDEQVPTISLGFAGFLATKNMKTSETGLFVDAISMYERLGAKSSTMDILY